MQRRHPARVAPAAMGAVASVRGEAMAMKNSSAAVEATAGPYSPSPWRQAPAPRAMSPVASTAARTLCPASAPSHAAPVKTRARESRRLSRSA